jgi:hypothetical protein
MFGLAAFKLIHVQPTRFYSIIEARSSDLPASAKLTRATAPTIRIRPVIELTSTCSERSKIELSRPMTGTSNSVNDVVKAGKFFETVIKAQNGKAVIKGPL